VQHNSTVLCGSTPNMNENLVDCESKFSSYFCSFFV